MVGMEGLNLENYSSWTGACRKAIQLTPPEGLPALAMKNGFPNVK